MENFEFYSPTQFVFGKDTENRAGELLKKYGAHKVLVVYGGKSAKESGLLDRVLDSLKKEGIEYFTLGGIKPNPRTDKVYEGIDIVRDNNIDFILPVGGGSVIDTAKAIAIGSNLEGDFWDLYTKKEDYEINPLPIGTVLTISAAGSEGSDSTVIQSLDGIKRGYHSDKVRPKFSIMNPELTETLPPYQTAAGIADMMAHILERYMTPSEDVLLTDELSEALLRTVLEEAPKVIENPNDYQARANIMWASTLAHNNLVGVGKVQDWTSHHLEHELSGLYDVTHGAGLAVIMPAVMEYIYKSDVPRFARLANKVFGIEMNEDNPEETAKQGIEAFRKFLKSIGMPLNFKDINAKVEDIPIMLESLGGDNIKEGAIQALDKDDIEAIYKLAANYSY